MTTAKQTTKTTDATDAAVKDNAPNDLQKLTDAIAAGVAAKSAVHEAAAQVPPVTPPPAEKSMWGNVKGFFTSPTMCTFGMLGASMLAGAVGGIAATEARSRGYLGGPGTMPAPMLPPPSNGQ